MDAINGRLTEFEIRDLLLQPPSCIILYSPTNSHAGFFKHVIKIPLDFD